MYTLYKYRERKKTTFNLAKLRCVDIIELFYDNFSLSFKDIHEYVDM